MAVDTAADSAPRYDAFISYKSEYKPWVEALARNLERQKLKVWFDDWRKVAGERITVTLEAGIAAARSGILIVTPEAAESGWVQKEYDTMVAEENRPRSDGSRFRVLPVILRESGGFPFLTTRFVVDFRDQTLYRRRLFELAQGVRGEAAPADGELDMAFEPPPPLPDTPATVAKVRVRSVFDAMFDDLDREGIVALFAQEAMGYGANDALVQQARERYGANHVIHLVPRIATEAESQAYFADLARQAGLPDRTDTPGRFGEALHSLVRPGQVFTIVLSQFENGPPSARRDFAHALTTFRATHRDEVRILLRGGEELASLKYEHGDISLLNAAWAAYWPELTATDVIGQWAKRGLDGSLATPVAEAILQVTGGEPRMVAHCLRRLGEMDMGDVPADAAALTAIADDLFADCDLCPQLFVPLRRETDSLARLCGWLSRSDVGAFTGAYLDHPVQRRLFWRNALHVRREGTRKVLAWRSEHLRLQARRILACDA